MIVHAGTASDSQVGLISAGGRVLTVVGLGEDIDEARSRAYESIAEIRLDGAFYRHDIAAGSFSRRASAAGADFRRATAAGVAPLVVS
jgi:phosphoribosylamine--glycine ligase